MDPDTSSERQASKPPLRHRSGGDASEPITGETGGSEDGGASPLQDDYVLPQMNDKLLKLLAAGMAEGKVDGSSAFGKAFKRH